MYRRVVGAKQEVIHHGGVGISMVSIKEMACFLVEGSVANECTDTT